MRAREALQTDSSADPFGASADQQRRWALGPYLDVVLVAASDSVALEGMSLRLEEWQERALRQFPEGLDENGSRWPRLIAEGLAFQSMCQGLFDQGSHGVDVTSEAAVGLALMQELQWTIDLAIADNAPDLARNIANFRNDLGHTVGLLRRVAGSDVFAEAQLHSRSLVRAVPRAPEAPRLREEEEEAEQSKRKITEMFRRDAMLGRIIFRQTVRPSYARELWMIVAVLAAAWSLLMFGPGGKGSQEPPLIDGSPFQHIAVFREASASPPSLYISVDRDGWEGMSPKDRFDTLREIAGIAEEAGYFGVHARIGGEVPAGRWIKGRGVQLFKLDSAERRNGNRA
jgi:hypothetical protein